MLNQEEIANFIKYRNNAGNYLGILEEAGKLLKKRSSIPRKVHQYKELFMQCVKSRVAI